MKQVIKMEHNKVKNPKMVGGEPVGFLTACSMVADLNSGLPWTNPASDQDGTWIWGLRISNPVL